MSGVVPIRRALLSVSDKSGLIDFARHLVQFGVELISTGGTAQELSRAGLRVIPIEQVTGLPEMLSGRVKTLHPRIHGGILAQRGNAAHEAAMREHGIGPIDLVCVNLYPFERTVARGAARVEAIEQIDVGGPAMIRAAAKNYHHVAVVCDPAQYERLEHELRQTGGGTTAELREQLAGEAFARTAEYDAAIAAYFRADDREAFPQVLPGTFIKVSDLRYGENPHQRAALYRDPLWQGPSIATARQVHGKELSYNNIADAAAALEVVRDLLRIEPNQFGACIVKHANPCGAAVGPTLSAAIEGALAGDPMAAFGGILAVNQPLDAQACALLCASETFLEVIVAPGFDLIALESLKQRSVNLRLLECARPVADDRVPNQPERDASGRQPLGAALHGFANVKGFPGGALVQDRDRLTAEVSRWTHAAGPAPSAARLREAAFVWTIAKHLSSNAIAIGGAGGGGLMLYGAGAGQMDRVTACRVAAMKAGERARGAIAASDAFFPFPDGPQLLIDAGVTMLVHPGGSRRDRETFDVCNARGITCMLTGVRHFRH